ncbi:hypothetical protein M758_5G025100 [Ceratodon purpureus]|uniref:MaoC-like domain-containing protein n=1 Tax=Ceratodon purpureus TaxID=3225 RepID=A0A8T0HY34_CERPU|nr:hypothetical protein KC19_5G023500 [Ceratodon purpureus]KAG0615227.1 hypothetical protein M758_5G025100 [Ceratodon purpureus]
MSAMRSSTLASLSARWIAAQGRRLSTESRSVASVKGGPAVVQEGQKFEMERCFTTQDVASYVSLCGDTNPIHTCDSAAQSAGFQGRVVQGMLYAGLFPAIIGSHFDGAVYVSQTLNFRSPVLVGDALCAEVEVTAVKKLRHHYRVTFATHCYKKGDPAVLLGGEAVALLPA